MATTSFERNFYVADNNIDAFIQEMSKPTPSAKNKKTTFKSHLITGEAVKKYAKGNCMKND